MFRRLTITVREWMFTLRTWLNDWLELLTSPVRAVRAFRPVEFASELFSGGKDALSLGRASVRIAVGTVVGFLGFLAWLPLHIVRFGKWSVLYSWWWLRTRTRNQLLFTAGAAVIVLGGVVGPGVYLVREHRREGRRALLWRHYDNYLQAGNAEKLESTLAALAELSPGDAIIAGRVQDLRARTAPPGDTMFMRFLMRLHFNEGHLDRSAREAAKLVEIAPDDWEARYFLLEDAAHRNDREAVQKHLAALPRALDAAESLPAHVAYNSAILFQRLNETERVNEIMEYIVLRVLPLLRRDDLPHFGPDVSILLVKCFHLTLTQLDRFPRQTQYWVPAQQACRSVVENPDAETRSLVALGEIQELQPFVLQEFLRRGKITPDECKVMTAEVEDRLHTLWDKVLERDPRNVKGYIGQAYHQARTGDMAGGVRTVARGLEVCGRQADLIGAMAGLLRESDPQAGLRFLQQALSEESLTPAMCRLYADLSQKAGRPDLALEACRRALKQDPNLVWPRYVEGDILLKLDKPVEAAATLKPIRAELTKDPAGCALYVRALCACGSYQLAEEFIEQVKAENRPVPVLLEAARAMQASGRLEDALRWASQVLEDDRANVAGLWVVADCLSLLAQQGDRGWDRDRAREALEKYRTIQLRQSKDLRVVNNIVWLELKALERPQEAFESAAPLRAVENAVGMPADFLETLGAVYLAVGRHEDARRMLRQAIATAGRRPSFYTHLALAYHGLKNQEQAEYYLGEAARMPKTNRELAAMEDANRVIQRR